MNQTIEPLSSKDQRYLDQHRSWLKHQSEKIDATLTAEAKVELIQYLLDEERVKKHDKIKIESLSVNYGDILVAEIPELEWVAVEDKDGKELALRWKNTSILIYPISDFTRQVTDYIAVDVNKMLEDFKFCIYDAMEDIA